jgi:antitoxin (DNA-binding transcriptional repressor) of toxin-antitoxin stability system
MHKEQSKPSTITASELNRAPGSVLRRVAIGKEQIIVERDGYPVAIISPYETSQTQSEKLLEAITHELQPLADELGLTEEQVIEDLRKTRKAIRRRKYGKADK